MHPVRRLLTLILLLAPAMLSGQTRPTSLIATQILYVTPDSARAFFAGNVLVDRRGLTLFERAPEPLPRAFTTNILAATADGRPIRLGPHDTDLLGPLNGWVGQRNLDSLSVGRDSLLAVLGSSREIARMMHAGYRPDRLADSASWYNFATLALYSDGTELQNLYRPEPNRNGIGGELAHALLVRVDRDYRWQRVVAVHPWTAACHASDRSGKEFVIPYCADSRVGVSPSGNYIVEAFVESGRPGFTILSLSAKGDTNFRKHFVMPTVPIPGNAMTMIAHTLDSLLTPAARATVTVPTNRRDFNTAIASDDGTVWIELDTPDAIPHRWIEIDRRGKLVGQVVMPKLTHLTGGLADELWGMVQEPAGPHYGVVRYKISKP